MRTIKTLPALGWAILFTLASSMAFAGDGHDHGDAPTTASGPAMPRFAAISETFELVGVVNGRRLTLYLDRYADGSPVKDAKLDLEIGGVKVPVEAHADGEFEAMLAQAPNPGVVAVTAIVVAGAESDLLAGELDFHDEATAGQAAHSHGWREYAMWSAAVATLVIALLILARRLRAARNVRLGDVA
ncbi:MAG: hypothetical protein RKO68_07640 [Candidatus Accumulibacter sp.]|nr:hypothetical protein [Accumulibacter sp.]